MRKFTRNILILLNLGVALGILLAYVSNHINPLVIWPAAFFGLAYPYFLLLNLFFLVFWLWRKNKYALISFIVLIIGFNNIGRYVQVRLPQPVEDDSSTLKILTHNVRVFNYFKWGGRDVTRDSILKYIASENPGIICLQEFLTRTNSNEHSEKHTMELLSKTPYSHIKYTLKTNSNTKLFGIATFSRFPIVRKGSINFNNSYNSCIYSDLIVNSDTIRVYNVHLQSIRLKKNDYDVIDSLLFINSKKLKKVRNISGRFKKAYIRRAQQVDQVKKYMIKSPYPVILCGDFNDTPVSYTYQQLLGDKQDAFRQAGAGVGNTYRGNLPSFRIDYIFHDNKFSTKGYVTRKVKLSDHYPVISSLKLLHDQ